ncbi:DEAD/DEAH box helicase [Candidatus Woesearchaeota archaeon]|nr:DEAD/DEAH box helicase [Candidatus Woesearchaeota archaeon]
MQYKGYTLDQFQIDAINAIEQNHSVVVSAQTGTGKTLVADYLINKFVGLNKKVVYTAPIKALSNQKYKDFKQDFGVERVGIITGDVVINSTAEILVMTTEIYRNMLITRDPAVQDIAFVVFDEIHYINDIERGTVWEESIIFSPEHIRFLCLSATIPNAREFAEWIASIKHHNVEVVKYEKRAVPLEHFVYDPRVGLVTAQEFKHMKDVPVYDEAMGNKKKQQKHHLKKLPKTIHLDLIKEIKNKLPAVFFVFSRKECEVKAKELVLKENFTTPEEKKTIIELFNRKITEEVKNLRSVHQLKNIITKGIAYHHAGLLPVLKDIVEELFAMNLIKVLYCTETFAVGVNYPAKTVCFDALEKYDGISFRYLNSKEYFQLAGRAGRRGIDTVGYAIAIVDKNYADLDKIIRFTSRDVDPIISQFKLTFNTVLNLIKNHTPEEIEIILKSNFDYYLRKKQNKNVRIMATFNHKLELLHKKKYITSHGATNTLTEKGEFTTHIFFNELLIAELFATDFHQHFTQFELLILIAAIIYEPRRADEFSFRNTTQAYKSICKKLEQDDFINKNINKTNLHRMIAFITHWASGGSFEELLTLSNYLEGDIIRMFRRLLDIIRQLRRATTDYDLSSILKDCADRIDRDVITVEF